LNLLGVTDWGSAWRGAFARKALRSHARCLEKT